MSGASASALYATPAGLERPLRVVLAASSDLPGWLDAFAAVARQHAWVEVTVLEGPETRLPTVRDVASGLRLFLAWERLLRPDANASLMPATPSRAAPGAGDERLSSLSLLEARVEHLQPDVVLLAGPQAWAASLARHAPWGCWQIDAGLTDPRHAGLSLLAPLLRGEASTHVGLTLDDGSGSSVPLAHSRVKTRATAFLLTRDDAYRKLPPLLLRSLHGIASRQPPAKRGAVRTLRLQPEAVPVRAAGLRLLASTLRAQVASVVSRLKSQDWSLVVREARSPMDPGSPVLGAYRILQGSRGWWADPCMVDAGGRKLVFVEEMDPATGLARIACAELADGGARDLGIVLQEPGHLSFPQVFNWQGQWQLTVESGYDRRVSLYRAVDFPRGWTRVRDLLTGWACVDPVLHEHEGRWYLFVNVAESGNSTSEDLFLFVAASPEGPFTPHPASPIVCDVGRARMAGRIFTHRGRLIRPGQDCGPCYGSAIVFNEILELGPDTYRERVLSRFSASQVGAVDACHSYSSDGGIEVLDILGRPPAGADRLELLDGGCARGAARAAAPESGASAVRGAIPERFAGAARSPAKAAGE